MPKILTHSKDISGFEKFIIENFKKSKQNSSYNIIHVLNFDQLFLEDLNSLRNAIVNKRACVLLLAVEPHYFDPLHKISKQWLQFKEILLKYQIFDCDFFIPCTFSTHSHKDSINYLSTNFYGWKFYEFNIGIPQIRRISSNDNYLDNSSTLFLNDCYMKFSHLTFTHRMHRQLFSKFLIREDLVRDNLIAINPVRRDVDEAEGRYKEAKDRLIKTDQYDGWFYNKHLLDLWRDVPIEYYKHPDITNDFDKANLNFLNKASFNIVSETVFNYPFTFHTEKTVQSFLARRPFIMIGPRRNLQQLRDQGFKTFPSIINESYDGIEDPNERLEAIMQLVLELNKKSQQELNDMVYTVKDILIHNYSLMLKKIKNFTNILE